MYNKFNNKPASVILLSVLLLGVLYMYIYQSSRAVSFEQQVMATDGRSAEVHVKTHGLHLVAPDHLQYQQPSIVKGRNDVVSVTPWLAPIVWEGTFNPVLLDGIYKAKNITVAATVFAVGKYIMFLKNFLETAEQHFFVGFNVHIYVFTDRPGEVPQVKMAAGRQLTVRSVPSSNRWQEISAGRMELIQVLIEEELRNHIDYIFCLDVDCQFHGRWGTESLGDLLTVIHPGYYLDDRSKFPYERRPQSRAYIAAGEGDFYYCAAVFGGLIEEVHQLAKTCRTNFEADAKEGIEAAWQDESHLNRCDFLSVCSEQEMTHTHACFHLSPSGDTASTYIHSLENNKNSGVHLHGDRCVCVADCVDQCVHGVEPGHVFSSVEDWRRWKSVWPVCRSAPRPEDKQLPNCGM